ncbi:MAG: SelT/SelW/SelH family protein [Solirubrobacteraceae bacterium]|nr:SelT/SelW/SelH family protein [Solirubrobacteraceae bacterium]
MTDAVHPATLPRVEIAYCTQCNWLLRAQWMAAELLQTFPTELGEVALLPRTGGTFTVSAAGTVVWDRRTDGGFPDAAELKRRVRDVIAPERKLGGHVDRR